MSSLTIEMVAERLKVYRPGANVSKIKGAYNLAKKIHKGHKRYSGDPYIEYLLEVLDVLLTLKSDEDTLIATMLQKAAIEELVSKEELQKKFGSNVSDLLKGLQELKAIKARITESKVETSRKMFLAIAQDLRVVLIKLAARLVSMKTLQYVEVEKQKKIARETMDVYIPVAARLGIYTLKSQLEDLAFKYLYPEQYEDIADQLILFGTGKTVIIDDIKNKLENFLKENGIEAYVDGRLKGVSSIYRKLKKKSKTSVDEIFDVFAMRIILKGNNESYERLYLLLGLIHSKWVPLANRFKDYVAIPKSNGYQSLHTAVLGLAPKEHSQPVEIQIRTERMHREAEYGVASHWFYESNALIPANFDRDAFANYALHKEDQTLLEMQHKHHIDWLHRLVKFQEDSSEDYNVDIFNDRIFVLTPQGEVKDLPARATPIDFAYAVHTDIGHRCAMAKVDGSIVPLDYELKSGEVVEIILKPKPNPKPHWLSFVKTNLAKSKIKAWFKTLDNEMNVQEGKNLLNKHLKRYGKPLLDESYSILKHYDGERRTLKDREAILEEIGTGAQLANVIVRKLYPSSELSQSSVLGKKQPDKEEKPLSSSILIGGEGGLPMRIASCCKPQKGVPIIAYITKGHVITIHKSDCSYVENLDEARFLSADWSSDKKIPGIKYKVKFLIEAVDRVGLLRDITSVIASFNSNIADLGLNKGCEGMFKRVLTVEVTDLDQFDRLLDKLEKIKNVLRVEQKF